MSEADESTATRALAVLHEALPRRDQMQRAPADERQVYEDNGGFERGTAAVHDYRLRRAVQALSDAGLLATSSGDVPEQEASAQILREAARELARLQPSGSTQLTFEGGIGRAVRYLRHKADSIEQEKRS